MLHATQFIVVSSKCFCREAAEAKAGLEERGSVSERKHSEGRPQFKHAKRVERKMKCREDVVVIPRKQRKRREGVETAVSRRKGLAQKELHNNVEAAFCRVYDLGVFHIHVYT